MASYRYIPELDWILVVEQVSDGTRSILSFRRSGSTSARPGLAHFGHLLGINSEKGTTFLSYQNNIEAKNRDLILRTAQLLEANAAREKLFFDNRPRSSSRADQ